MEKPKREETRTEAQQIQDLPVNPEQAADVKGGAVDTFKTKQSLLPCV